MASKNQSERNAIEKALSLRPLVKYAGCNPKRGIKVWFVAGSKNVDYAVWEQGEGAHYEAHCTCQAGTQGYHCYHIAAVILAKIAAGAIAALNTSIAQREAQGCYQPMCQMCEQEPATDFSEQPRCAACVTLCEREDARKAQRAALKRQSREDMPLRYYFSASGLPLKAS